MDVVIPAGGNDGKRPQLRLMTADLDGKVRFTSPVSIPNKPIPWTVDFQLPQSVRIGEELIVDIVLTNQLTNCSQVCIN